jgi:proline dehydrogenase
MKEASELSIMMIKEMRQAEKIIGKKNIVGKIISQIQKSEPDLVRETLKDVIDLTSDMGE